MSTCTIVMFHYVRDLKHSRYPEIKGCDLATFRGQLDYIQSTYVPVSADDIRACLNGERSLPPEACLLTFDDGYLDHYTDVFPELVKRGLSGCFYPPVNAVQRDKVLEVNKIHLLLAHVGYAATDRLIETLRCEYERMTHQRTGLPSFEDLWKEYAHPGRFDTAEVIFFKRVLQHALPLDVRTVLLDRMFRQHMDADEITLARELYLSTDMLRIMAKAGMHIGSHGTSHAWLDKIDVDAQRREIDGSLAMLETVYGGKTFFWSIAYPFGGNNASLQEICSRRGAVFGMTTVAGPATVSWQNRLVLPRLDTNDLPHESATEPHKQETRLS